MSGRTYVFDLETKRLANEVGGWSHIDKLGLSAAVLLHVETGEVLHFLEQDVDDLVANLLSADHVVGFNILRFDYTVLRPYGFTPGPELVDCTIDLLEHIYQALGFRLSLDNLAEATLGIGKSADGLQAVAWFREGKVDKVLDYCEQDVRVTYRLWMHGVQYKQVKYRDRSYRLRVIPVSW